MAPPKGHRFGPKRPWTDTELALVRELWPLRNGPARLAAALPQRSATAIQVRASKLGVDRGRWRLWTDEEIATLTRLWPEYGRQTVRKALPHRAWKQIWLKAGALGLRETTQGLVSVTEAAHRCGVTRPYLNKILRAAEVPTQRCKGQTTNLRRPHRMVDPDLAREAMEAWLERESITAAARRLDVDPSALHRELVKQGAVQPERGRRVARRMESAVLERAAAVVAERRGAA